MKQLRAHHGNRVRIHRHPIRTLSNADTDALWSKLSARNAFQPRWKVDNDFSIANRANRLPVLHE